MILTDVFHNTWAWQEFPRHRPVVPPKTEAGFHCAWRDEEGRRCGREMNYGRMGLRHNPPLGVPHRVRTEAER